MFSRLAGAMLGTVATVLLVASIPMDWWAGYPLVDGRKSEIPVYVGLLGGGGCNPETGACKAMEMATSFTIASYGALAATAVAALAMLALAISTIAKTRSRGRLAKIVITAAAVGFAIGVLLVVMGPTPATSHRVTMPGLGGDALFPAYGAYAFFGGILTAIAGSMLAVRGPEPARLPQFSDSLPSDSTYDSGVIGRPPQAPGTPHPGLFERGRASAGPLPGARTSAPAPARASTPAEQARASSGAQRASGLPGIPAPNRAMPDSPTVFGAPSLATYKPPVVPPVAAPMTGIPDGVLPVAPPNAPPADAFSQNPLPPSALPTTILPPGVVPPFGGESSPPPPRRPVPTPGAPFAGDNTIPRPRVPTPGHPSAVPPNAIARNVIPGAAPSSGAPTNIVVTNVLPPPSASAPVPPGPAAPRMSQLPGARSRSSTGKQGASAQRASAQGASAPPAERTIPAAIPPPPASPQVPVTATVPGIPALMDDDAANERFDAQKTVAREPVDPASIYASAEIGGLPTRASPVDPRRSAAPLPGVPRAPELPLPAPDTTDKNEALTRPSAGASAISTAPDSLPPPSASKAASGPSPACPQCDSPMAWIEEHLRFYCKSCRMYF